MKTAPLRPAEIAFDDDGTPCSPAFDNVYHARAGALAQSRHVFLGGNGLPQRWRGAARFTVLETGFGLGNNFLATWDTWKNDARRCERLHYIGIEKHPLTRADLARVHAASPLCGLAEELLAQWPVPTPNIHRLDFEGGRVQLLLAWFDVRDVLPEIVAEVDAFFLDGFAPAKNPAMWEGRVCKALGRIAAPGATAATWSVARELRDGLAEAGFAVEKASGFDAKREMTVARFEPRFTPRRPAARRVAQPHGERHAVIVGGGLAGCATAWALAEQGWRSTLLERRGAPAQETSGQRAGLFHGSVNWPDAVHARFNRAAALMTERLVRPAVASGRIEGEVAGLLRLVTSDVAVRRMQAMADALALPAGYVQPLGIGETRALSGLPVTHPAWFYPGGGWLRPDQLARYFLECAGEACTFRGSLEVTALRVTAQGWQLLDARGAPLEEAQVIVLANGLDALRLLGPGRWPLRSVRGQTTALRADTLGPIAPRLPLTGGGFSLPMIDGEWLCGATSQVGNAEAGLSDSDHRTNLEQLARLVGVPALERAQVIGGRVGWRVVAHDRLPVLGGVPDASASACAARLDRPRFVPRAAGLYVHTALASRGITWAALSARTLAALVAGAPVPLESSLLDAVDAGRFASRAAR